MVIVPDIHYFSFSYVNVNITVIRKLEKKCSSFGPCICANIREISALVLLEIDLKLIRITTRKALQTDSMMIPQTSPYSC